MVPTESGNVRPASCRDKGRGGVDEGAWCLSWLGCDLVAPRSPHWSALPPGQAPGPHPAPHPPLVPTGPHAVVSIHQERIPRFGRQHSSGGGGISSPFPIRLLKFIRMTVQTIKDFSLH